MAHVTAGIVGASLKTAVSPGTAGHRPGTVGYSSDNSKAIYAIASEAIAAGTALCTVTRVGADDFTAAATGGSLTCEGGAASGEGAWFSEAAEVTVS